MIFDAPRRPSISRHIFRKNGPFSSSNMSGAGTPTWEGVPRPKHIPFDAPNWRTIGHKFGVRAVSHVVVRCSDILALDFQKMIKNVCSHASRPRMIKINCYNHFGAHLISATVPTMCEDYRGPYLCQLYPQTCLATGICWPRSAHACSSTAYCFTAMGEKIMIKKKRCQRRRDPARHEMTHFLVIFKIGGCKMSTV